MKTALSIIGIVFLVLLFLLACAVGVFIYVGTSLDASSKAYVDESVPAIVTTWSQEEMTKRESDQFRRATGDDQLTRLFTRFRELGALQKYEGSKGDANISFTPNNGLMVTGSYLANATFQNGKAEIRINVIRVGDTWKIYGFRIESPLFLK